MADSPEGYSCRLKAQHTQSLSVNVPNSSHRAKHVATGNIEQPALPNLLCAWLHAHCTAHNPAQEIQCRTLPEPSCRPTAWQLGGDKAVEEVTQAECLALVLRVVPLSGAGWVAEWGQGFLSVVVVTDGSFCGGCIYCFPIYFLSFFTAFLHFHFLLLLFLLHP